MKKQFNLGIIIILIIILLSGCKQNNIKSNSPIEKQGFLLNTFIDIKIYDTKESLILDEAFENISNLEKILSTHIKDSDVYRINENAGVSPVVVSKDTIFLIEKSIEYSNDTKGLFDITIYPLVQLWDINNNPKVPSNDELKSTQSLINFNKIEIDKENSSVFLKEKGMELDLGGIAKGYIGDKTKEFLIDKGVKKAILNLGGNVILIGEKSENIPWKIGIQDPNGDSGEYLGTLDISNKSIVTSGIYERYFESDGVRYHHILNPFTGYPENNSLSGISIITDNSTDGDALSTSIFLLGLEKGMDYVSSNKAIKAIFITRDNKIYISPGLKDKFILDNKEYKKIIMND